MLTAAGRPATTIRLRRYQILHLAQTLRPACESPADVAADALVGWAARQPWKRNTRRSFRGAARSFFGWAYDTGLIPADPSRRLPSVRTPAPDPRPTPTGLLRDALAAADPRVVLMIRLGHELGMRRAEVAQAHSDDIVEDLLGWSLRVHGKGDKVRTIPMHDDLARLVRSLPAGYFFPGAIGGHVSADWLGKLVSRTFPPGWSMHSLRHRFATDAWVAGGDLAVVQTLMGHSSPQTTRGYIRLPDEALRRVVDRVAELGHAA
jgi:integrase